MIFVTVGTHEQQFNRLVECVDLLKRDGIIEEEVIIQAGFSTYEPKYCKWSKLFSYDEMTEYVKEARIVITHGGPASFIMPLQMGKTPIVVPRCLEYEEHVNNHQVEFAQNVAQRMGTIIPVCDIEKLGQTINSYEEITASMTGKMKSNNQFFNAKINDIVQEMFSDRKETTRHRLLRKSNKRRTLKSFLDANVYAK